ncbi:MAG: hypothetical protein AAGC95_02295 [Pseudomonadota bacterium]
MSSFASQNKITFGSVVGVFVNVAIIGLVGVGVVAAMSGPLLFA